MSIAGTWDVTVDTPMGRQESVLRLVFSTNGNLTGTTTSSLGATAIADAVSDGNTARWTVEMTTPFPMTLLYTVTVADDRITGKVRAGDLGTSLLAGSRASS